MFFPLYLSLYKFMYKSYQMRKHHLSTIPQYEAIQMAMFYSSTIGLMTLTTFVPLPRSAIDMNFTLMEYEAWGNLSVSLLNKACLHFR